MSSEDQGGAGRREVAYRLLAAEFDDADFSYSEGDEERAPNYVVTPTGARVNRLFVVGVLTEVEQAGEDVLRARVVDPTGAFVVYAGQYQPEAQTFFDRADPPAFVAVTGKARTFQPDDSDVVYTSVRPENVNEVTAETRDRWNVQVARQSVDRVATMADALAREERGDELRQALETAGVDVGLAAGIPLAIDHYGTTPRYLNAVRELASQVAEVVAGERDEVDPLTLDPDAPGDVDLEPLAHLDVPESPGSTRTGHDTDATASADETAEGTTTSTETVEEDTSPDTTGSTDDSEETVADTEEEAETDIGTDTDATEPAGGSDVAGDIGEFEPGEFDLDEAERESIEAEYGTEFTSGTEVDDPGEADIETPGETEVVGADGTEADDGADGTEADDGADGTEADDGADGTEADDGDEDGAEDVDIETAVMEAMRTRDEGGGAPEGAVVEDVTSRLGVDGSAVEDALQDALMSGQCYEPEDGVYKPI
jgi:RPA family protein